MKRRNTFIFCALVAGAVSYASERNHRVDHVSLEQGVSHNMIYCIVQDRKGFMWFGTMYGLIKYDGYSYTTYRHNPKDPTSLTNDDIVTMLEDHKGNLWIGTFGGGVNMLDRRSGLMTRYDHNPSDSNTIASGIVWTICEDRDGMLWMGTEGGGVDMFDPSTKLFTHSQHDSTRPASLTNDYVYALSVGDSGSLWVGTMGGLDRYDKETGTFTHFKHKEGEPSSISSDRIRSLYYDRSGILWVGTENGGLNELLPDRRNFRHYNSDPRDSTTLTSNGISTIAEDRSGDLWIGTSRGLNRFDREKRTFLRMQHDPANENSLRSDRVIAVCQDRSGLLWVGTYLGGLDKVYLDGSPFGTYRHSPDDPGSLVGNIVNAILEDRGGNVWIGTRSGLDEWEETEKTFSHFSRPISGQGGYATYNVRALCEDSSGTIWVGTNSGLEKRTAEGKRIAHYLHDQTDSHSVSASIITWLMTDRDGSLWVGTIAGLDRFNATTNTFTHFGNDDAGEGVLAGKFILSLYQDRYGLIWVGTYRGVYRLDPAQGVVERFRQDPSDSTSISNNYAFAFHEDHEGTLWIGTAGGLNTFDRETRRFKYFTETDGLPNSVVCGILESPDGVLWLSTNKGLSQFDVREGIFKNYDIADGLQSNMFMPGAFCKRINGALLFGGINGFNEFTPAAIKGNAFRPPVVITSFSTFDGYTPTTDPAYTDALQLSYDQNFFAFTFAALDFTRPEKNRYAFMLEGVDKGWNFTGGHQARYTDIAPGEYTFRVRASNNDGLWNYEGTSIRLSIAPPFWRTTWFYVLCLVAAIAGVLTLHNRRVASRVQHSLEIENIRRREAELIRKKAAEDFHDELGHRLTKIGLFSELVKRSVNGASPEAASYLEKIIDGAHSLSNDTRDFIWSLDPSKDSLSDLMVHLRDFAEDLFERTSVSFSVVGFTDALASVNLSMETRRHVILIFKEGMHNALKHADCKSVVLSVELKEGNVEITLTDDGKGYAESDNGHGHGLRNMKGRAEKIRGTIRFVSRPGAGSSIRLVTRFST